MTDEKEVEIFFWHIFRNLWLKWDISLEPCSVAASTHTILSNYKKPILETMLKLLPLHKSKTSEIVKKYFEAELSAKGYDQFPEIALRFLDGYLKNLKSFHIFLKMINSCCVMSMVGAQLYHQGFRDVLQMTISLYSKYFIDKLKDNFYKSDAWNKIRTDIKTTDFINIISDKQLEVSETKKSVHEVQCEKGTASKPLSSSYEIKKKRKNNKHFPRKSSTSTISDSSSDLSDLSDYEIIGLEVFPIKKNCSDKKQVRKMVKESFSHQHQEFASKEIIGGNGRKSPKCSARQSQQNSFAADIPPSFITSEDTVNQRSVQCHYRQNINNQQNVTHVQETCNVSNIKTHIIHSKDITGGRQTEDHKFSSSRTEKIFSNSKNDAEAGIDKSSSKEKELQLEISARCREVTETHRGGNIKDNMFLQNSFQNLNESVGKIVSKTKTLVLKSDIAEGTNFPHALLKSKAAKTNSHKTVNPSTESRATHSVEGSLNIRRDSVSDIVKNNSNNCNKNEMQSSAASSSNQVSKVGVKYKEEKKEYFDHAKENDLKLCWKDKSSKRDKSKKKRRNFKK